MSQIKFKMIVDDLDPDTITHDVIAIVNQWFIDEDIQQNDVQKSMLLSHTKAMVHRAKTLEPLPEVDPSLFDEISAKSMALAHKTIALFDTLAKEEAYLLAVHYEVARANEI